MFPAAYENLAPKPSHREAVIDSFVYVHQSLHQANAKVARRSGRVMAITPRHYLDFINHFVRHVYKSFCHSIFFSATKSPPICHAADLMSFVLVDHCSLSQELCLFNSFDTRGISTIMPRGSNYLCLEMHHALMIG